VRDSTAAEPIAVAIDVTERSSYGPMYGPAAEILDEADLDWTGSGQEDNRGVAPLRNATKSRRLIGHRLVAAECSCSLEAQCYRTSTGSSVQSFADQERRSARGELLAVW
jgi:hypothetical protein